MIVARRVLDLSQRVRQPALDCGRSAVAGRWQGASRVAMSPVTSEPTNQDLLDAIKAVDERINSVYHRLTGIENRLTTLEQTFPRLVSASPVPV